MKAITLFQPWASLVASGAKKIETRSWPAPKSIIGQRLAIHASRRRPDPDAWVPWEIEEISAATGSAMLDLPLGAVVATALVAGAYRSSGCIIGAPGFVGLNGSQNGSPARAEIAMDDWGDFSWGRWLWVLDEIEAISPPIPARGMQGVWEWARR